MKVTLYMAMSINGIIAGEDNNEDFLSHDNWLTLLELVNPHKALIWGRKTKELVDAWDPTFKQSLDKITKVIVSHQTDYEPGSGHIKAQNPRKALELLESHTFSEAILSGGSHLNNAFAQENLIDEIILNIEPVIVGKGIPVFSPDIFQLNLQFIESKMINPNLIQLSYKVLKS